MGIQDQVLPSELASSDLGPLQDAFGRIRISEQRTIFECSFPISTQPLLWSSSTSSGATITHDADKASVLFTMPTTSGAQAIFQTRQYFAYHPGKSQFCVFTGNIGGAFANRRNRVGMFDTNNGIFFEADGTTAKVVMRSRVSGSVVDTSVAQSSWNLDKLDGTGASGVNIDFTKQQIFCFDYQWLGSGRIRLGTIIDGKIIYAHQFLNANNLSVPYSQTGTLPFRVEVTNTGTVSQIVTSWLTCCTISSEAGYGPEGIVRSTGNSTQKSVTSSLSPVFSLRKQSAYVQWPIKIISSYLFCNSADDLIISIYINPTLTGASWSNIDGICQSDVSSTSQTGGTLVYQTPIRGASGSASIAVVESFFNSANLVLGSDLSGASDIITISATSISGNASAFAFLNYRELV